jgi:hypothetical protein
MLSGEGRVEGWELPHLAGYPGGGGELGPAILKLECMQND